MSTQLCHFVWISYYETAEISVKRIYSRHLHIETGHTVVATQCRFRTQLKIILKMLQELYTRGSVKSWVPRDGKVVPESLNMWLLVQFAHALRMTDRPMQWILHLDGYMEIATKWLCTKATIYWKEPTIIRGNAIKSHFLAKKNLLCNLYMGDSALIFSMTGETQ